MSKERFNLTWDNFDQHLKEILQVMLKNDDMADVTLVSDDMKQIKVHKLILSSCSSVLKSILSLNNFKNSVIFLDGILFEELEAIIQFMYLGKTTLQDERIDYFFEATKSLDVKELNQTLNASTSKSPNADIDNDKSHEGDIHMKEQEQSIHEERSLVDQGKAVVNNGYMNQFLKVAYNKHDKVQSLENDDMKVEPEKDINIKDKASESVEIDSRAMTNKKMCRFCFKHFTQTHITAHIRKDHEGWKYKCSHCDKILSCQSAIYRHIKFVHREVVYNTNQYTMIKNTNSGE